MNQRAAIAFVASATIATLVALFISFVPHVRAQGAPPHCPATIAASLFYQEYGDIRLAAYHYDGAKGVALYNAMVARFGVQELPARLPEMWVTLDIDAGEIGIWAFDGVDCHPTGFLFGFDLADAADILGAAGLTVPFGPTYHQLPDAPPI